MCPESVSSESAASESTGKLEIYAAGAADIEIVRGLFLEYADWLQVDLCFQGFEAELAGLPGAYVPPGGGLWLAKVSGELAGVVGLRPLETGHAEGRAEMKRLWVRPGFRGHSLGRRLTEVVIDAAKAAGYKSLCLDTLAQMKAAHGLYRSLGFSEIEPYYGNPLEGVRYLVLSL